MLHARDLRPDIGQCSPGGERAEYKGERVGVERGYKHTGG